MRGRGPWWRCEACGSQNHEEDGTCQFCECEGATCKRASCDGPEHPGHGDPFYDLTEDDMRAMRDAYEGTPRRKR